MSDSIVMPGASTETLRALYFALGRVLLEHERPQDAAGALEQALREKGEDVHTAAVGRLLAVARARVEDHDGALDASLQALLDAGPDEADELLAHARTAIAKARLAAHRERLRDARWPALLKRAALPRDTRSAIGELLGRALLDIGEPETADRVLTATVVAGGVSGAVLRLRATALELSGRPKDAYVALAAARAAALDRGDHSTIVEIDAQRVRVLLATGQVELAVSALPDASHLDGQLRATALEARAAVLLASGDAEQALAASADALQIQPGGRDLLRLHGQALLALHRGDEALTWLGEALQANVTNEELRVWHLVAQIENEVEITSPEKLRRHFGDLEPTAVRACLADPSWRGRSEDGRAHHARAALSFVLGDLDQAAEACREALRLGLGEGLPNEPEAPVHALLAEALDGKGLPEAGVEPHYLAGAGYHERGESSEAIRQLQYAVERQPDHPRASWFLADALRYEAATLSPSLFAGADLEDGITAARSWLLAEAREVWDRAADLLAGNIVPWAYSTRALIDEESTTVDPARRIELLWSGLVHVERGLAFDADESFAWRMLARLYRRLRLEGLARTTTESVLMRWPDDLDLLVEHIVVCNNTGDYAAVLETTDRRESLLDKSGLDEDSCQTQRAWHDAFRASALEGLGRYDEALPLLERSLPHLGGELWPRDLLGHLHRLTGDRASSLRVYAELLDEPDTGEHDWIGIIGDAHFAFGHADEALRFYERLRNLGAARPTLLEISVGLCEVMKGQLLQGQKRIEATISGGISGDELTQLRYGLRVVRDEASERLGEQMLDKLTSHLIGCASRALKNAVPPADDDGELLWYSDSDADQTRAAVFAGMARRCGERDDWTAAAGWYERLAATPRLFPELDAVRKRVAQALEQNAQAAAETDPIVAAETLESALAIARSAKQDPSTLMLMRQRLGDAFMRDGNAAAARAQYAAAEPLIAGVQPSCASEIALRLNIASLLDQGEDIRHGRVLDMLGVGGADLGRLLGETAASLVGDLDAYARLDRAWAVAQEAPTLGREQCEALTEARAALLTLVDEALGCNRTSEPLVAVVTPIVLELGEALLPLVDPSHDGGHFIDTLLSAMRERIVRSTGVPVPGVRARGNPSLEPNEFVVQVDEVSVERERLPATDAMYAFTPGAGERKGLTDFHPLTGERGLWTVRVLEARSEPDQPGHVVDATASPRAGKLTAADALAHFLERVVRRHLTRFLGPQEVADLVESQTAQQQEPVAGLIDDRGACLRLTWVLQRLVADGVPVTDLPALLAGIRDAGGIDANATALHRAIRLRIGDELPRPATGLVPISVPPEHEKALAEDGALTGQIEFRRWLRSQIARSGPALVLITEESVARERAAQIARSEGFLLRTLTVQELSAAEGSSPAVRTEQQVG